MRIHWVVGSVLYIALIFACSSGSGGGGDGGRDPVERALAYCTAAGSKCGTSTEYCSAEVDVASLAVAAGCAAEVDAFYDCVAAKPPTCGDYGPESPSCDGAGQVVFDCMPWCDSVDVDFSQFACAGTKLSFQVDCDCDTMVCTCKGGPKSGWTFSGTEARACDVIGHDPLFMGLECT